MKLIISAFFFLIAYSQISFSQPVVNTKFGPIMGKDTAGVMEFLGVPFAKPPVDSLRWKPPQDPDKWTTVLITQAFKPGCLQKKYSESPDTNYTVLGSEDCLYLNVWTPDTVSKTLPVLVFIHGGGNQQGAAYEVDEGTQINNGKNMAERGPAIIVTIDYRLGPFGFLVHPGLDLENANHISGNYGLMDQIKALQWVHNNISSFGGDTSKVMIFGESAGGIDVGDLILSPLVKGLFTRACIESAIPAASSFKNAKDDGVKFVDRYISIGTDSQKIVYMRKLPADSLIKYEPKLLAGGIAHETWEPVVDNYVLLNNPILDLAAGEFNKVPLIIGSNADECSLSSPVIVTPAMVSSLMNTYVPRAYVSQGLSLYPPGNDDTIARNSYVQLLTDKQFTAAARMVTQFVCKNQNEPVWRYFFTYAQHPAILKPFGSYHGIEVPYVFNNWENTNLGKGILFTAQDDSVETNMLKYWINFANTGNPNGDGLVKWSQYVNSTDCYLEINATPNGSLEGVRTEKCNFWYEAWGIPTGIKDDLSIQSAFTFKLNQNYPNPFNPSTNIQYAISSRQFVSLKVYDILGREVATLVNEEKPAGNYIVEFFADNLPSGIYFYQLRSGNYVSTKKMILLKYSPYAEE